MRVALRSPVALPTFFKAGSDRRHAVVAQKNELPNTSGSDVPGSYYSFLVGLTDAANCATSG